MKKKISLEKKIKKIVVQIVMFVLGKAIQSASRWDSIVRHEVARWPDDFTFALDVLPWGPRMSMKKQGGRLKYLGAGPKDVDLLISFKNIECAFLVFSGLMGTEQGAAERRTIVKGDLTVALSLIRIINLVEVYLYPRIISRRLVKRVPKLNLKQHALRVYIMLIGIPTGI
jgi:hypothetical protein